MTAPQVSELGRVGRRYPAWGVAVWFVVVRLVLLACMVAFVGIMGVPSRHVGTTLILWLIVIVPVGSYLVWKSHRHVRSTLGPRAARISRASDIALGIAAAPTFALLLLLELLTTRCY